MRLYFYGALVLALLGSHFWTYRHGLATARAESEHAVLEAKKHEDAAIAKLNQQEKELRVIYRDRIRVVKESTDACLDQPLPAALLGGLRADLPPE